MTLLICLPFFSIYMVIILIRAYMYLNQYTHFPPLPYSYTFLAISKVYCLCYVLYLYLCFCASLLFSGCL